MLREKLRHNAITITYPIGAEDQFKGMVDLVQMKAFYFDGDNGENIREEAIPADIVGRVQKIPRRPDRAVGEFDDTVGRSTSKGRSRRRRAPRRHPHGDTDRAQVHPGHDGSAYKNKGVQLLLDAVTITSRTRREEQTSRSTRTTQEAKVILKSDPKLPFVGSRVQARRRPLRSADLHAHLPGHASTQGRRHLQLVQRQEGQGAAPRADARRRDERHRETTGRRHRRVLRRRLRVGRHVHRRQGQVHDDLDVHPERRHLAGDPAQGQGERRPTSRRRSTSSRRKIRPSACTATKSPPRPSSAGMGELHLEIYCERIKREYNCEVIVGKPQVAFRETITQQGRLQLHPQEADRWLGSVRQGRGLHRAAAGGHPTGYEFVDDITGGSIPREFIPACDKGFHEAIKEGRLIGFPIVGVRACINDGASHDVDSSEHGVQDGRPHGLPRSLHEGQARPFSSRS